jgi:serine acetyltransferase
MFIKVLTFFFPWTIRRAILNKLFGYNIHKEARIGLAWVFPKELVMEKGSRIDHFTVAINLDRIVLNAKASIGRGNWITGYSTRGETLHFKHQVDRKAELIVGNSSSITKNHHIDCTNSIIIGQFATIAGYNSQFLTHSINLKEGRQDSAPIIIGNYTLVGTNVVILGGSVLPDYSVLGAKSLLNKKFINDWKVYGGVPAKELKEIPKDNKYFLREDGFVY